MGLRCVNQRRIKPGPRDSRTPGLQDTRTRQSEGSMLKQIIKQADAGSRQQEMESGKWGAGKWEAASGRAQRSEHDHGRHEQGYHSCGKQ